MCEKSAASRNTGSREGRLDTESQRRAAARLLHAAVALASLPIMRSSHSVSSSVFSRITFSLAANARCPAARENGEVCSRKVKTKRLITTDRDDHDESARIIVAAAAGENATSAAIRVRNGRCSGALHEERSALANEKGNSSRQ